MRILTFAQLKQEKGIGYSRVHLSRLIAKGLFPRPISHGTRTIRKDGQAVGAVGWIEEEIDDHLEARKAERWGLTRGFGGAGPGKFFSCSVAMVRTAA